MGHNNIEDRRVYEAKRYANPIIREHILAKNRKYRETRRHDFMLREKYNITEERYVQLLQEQNGVCAICKQPETTIRQGTLVKLSVDHCHTTNKIRGLLCKNCNTGLGAFRDSPRLLAQAIEYLV